MLAPVSRRRAAWFDPRIAVGLVIVVASVAGVVAIVGAADSSATVWTASEPLAAGTRVSAADLTPARARLGGAQGLYLSGPLPRTGLVATRTIDKGEMVPMSALGSAAQVDTASMVLDLSGRLPGSVAAGSVVDVWAAPKKTSTGYGPPQVLVSGATVVRIVPDGGLVATGDTTSVELRVPRDAVAQVLQSVADQDQVSAVAVGSPVGP